MLPGMLFAELSDFTLEMAIMDGALISKKFTRNLFTRSISANKSTVFGLPSMIMVVFCEVVILYLGAKNSINQMNLQGSEFVRIFGAS